MAGELLAQLRDSRSQDIFDLFGEDKFHLLLHWFRQLGQILLVLLRQDHALDPHPARRQDLLFNSLVKK